MNVPTISAVAMAAMTMIVGAWHLLLWSHRRQLRVHLSFGLTCLAVSFYDATCAGLYQAASLIEGVRWQMFQSLGMAMGAVTFCWFVFDYTSSRDRLAPSLLTVAQGPIVLALVLGQRWLLWTPLDATKRVELPLYGTVVYHEAAPGILSDYQTILGLLVFFYAFYVAARMIRSGERGRGLPLVLATALFFAGAVNDSAIQLGLYSSVYLIEYSFLGLVLLMTNTITQEALRAQTLSAALVASEERYRQFVEGTEDLVVRAGSDGTLLYANQSCQRLLGWAPSACLGRRAIELIHADDRDRTRKVLAAAFAAGGSHADVENRVVGAGGEVRDVMWTVHCQHSPEGRVIAVNAIGRDISHRKRIEQALQESEQAYQALVESALQAVAVFDGPRYVFVNARMTEIFGWSREEFLGMSAEQAARIVHPDDRPMVLERRMARQAGREPPSVYEFRIVRKDGAIRWVQVFANAIQYRGRACGLAVYVDITARHEAEAARQKAEQERLKLEAQLRHAHKMEAVGLLAGGVAHDFNNLLQAIVGYTQLARRLVSEQSPVHKHLGHVMTAADRASSLTRQLLAFSRTEAQQLRPVQINDLVADLVKMLGRVLGDQIELSVRTPPDVGVAMIDYGQIEQALMNLCVNARDAMHDGGRLGIDTSRVELDEAFCAEHPWASPKAYVELTVSDTGPGIPPEIRERIFEPFFTTKEVGKGTGLGLATVYAIVERHGGGITVDSEVGRGSLFRVFLPASGQPQARAPEPWAGEAIAGGSETILVAEDDDDVRTLATTVLQAAGYRVLAAADGDEAIRLMGEKAGDVALAVIDVVMPGKGGLEVRDAIRSSGNRIPIVFSTGYAPAAERNRSPSMAEDPVLLKPYQPADLLRTVRHLLDEASARA